MPDARFGLQNLLRRARGLEGKRSFIHGGGELQQTFGALNLGVVAGLCHGVYLYGKKSFFMYPSPNVILRRRPKNLDPSLRLRMTNTELRTRLILGPLAAR